MALGFSLPDDLLQVEARNKVEKWADDGAQSVHCWVVLLDRVLERP
jgi:hypothetical protein